jgi:hypothetical protein
VILGDELKLVWKHMSTNLINLKETDILGNGIDMEVPDPVYLASDTVSWLVCLA